ncbi:CMD domain-containing protein [Aquamicrobium defluvii]|uniref:CMD domain-containing protein n=1 Tax=Aquamicrobium defluvii TaxID=69279 RepID=UPI0004B86EE1|nr:hypothetical protein [Aquamicrobium defluvii]
MTGTRDVIADIVDIAPGSELAGVIARRADIMALTQLTHDGALTPETPGGLDHAERAAFACRIARINDDEDFAAHFEAIMATAGASDTTARIADLRFTGGSDARLAALIRHVDLVARTPADATRRDIESLREAGVGEADIVRLSELIAFVSYQIRVAAGLRLLRGLS